MHYSTLSDPEETIAAVASATGAGQRGIIRLSGTKVVSVVERFLNATAADADKANFDLQKARRYEFQVSVGDLGVFFPVAVFLWPGKQSYTGQPAAELHTLGSSPLLEAFLGVLFASGARPAKPGEFTLRSFLAGKMSLVQAEGVLGVIDARTDEQLDVALSQLAGGISHRMRIIREQLLDDLADLEAGLDFVEEDIEFVNRGEFTDRLRNLLQEIDALCESARSRMHETSAVCVVLAGLPNAGKSSLFNKLTGEQALVSDIQGTTTDYLTGTFSLDHQEIQLCDTAGWETGQTEIAKLAQQFRHDKTQKAELLIWCTAADLTVEERAFDQQCWEQIQQSGVTCWRILTKADQLSRSPFHLLDKPRSVSDQAEAADFQWAAESDFESVVDCRTEIGTESLLTSFSRFLAERQSSPWELLGSTAARCEDSLRKTRDHLLQATELSEGTLGDEFVAEEIRGAIQELGIILGHVYTDDLLDRVFSKFCIGK